MPAASGVEYRVRGSLGELRRRCHRSPAFDHRTVSPGCLDLEYLPEGRSLISITIALKVEHEQFGDWSKQQFLKGFIDTLPMTDQPASTSRRFQHS